MWLYAAFKTSFKVKKMIYNDDNLLDLEAPLTFGSQIYVFVFLTFLDDKKALNIVLHGIFGLLGPLVDIFFYTMHLLLYINISDAAMYIVKSVTGKIKYLLNTLFVAIFLLYSYSSLAANNYSDKFDVDDIDVCKTLASCFLYTFNLGLRNGGGLADSMKAVTYG
jgi:hypothetical protein